MSNDLFLQPGVMNPMPDGGIEDTAARFGVETDVVVDWIARGLPGSPQALDPFAVCNWLSWGHLDQCKALDRRWRTFLATFSAWLIGCDAPRRVRWARTQRVYLPLGGSKLEWWLAKPMEESYQRVISDSFADNSLVQDVGPAWFIAEQNPVEGPVTVSGFIEVEISPRTDEVADDERAIIEGAVCEVVSEFIYGYRRHLPHNSDQQPGTGSCLDCSREVAGALAVRGYSSRMMGGIIARDEVVNPHFWLEVQTKKGDWISVDPTLPAIARMLKADWKKWVSAYVGGHDARRITLARGESPIPAMPGGAAYSLSIGEVRFTDLAGKAWNAWPCIDWVCGECDSTFEVL